MRVRSRRGDPHDVPLELEREPERHCAWVSWVCGEASEGAEGQICARRRGASAQVACGGRGQAPSKTVKVCARLKTKSSNQCTRGVRRFLTGAREPGRAADSPPHRPARCRGCFPAPSKACRAHSRPSADPGPSVDEGVPPRTANEREPKRRPQRSPRVAASPDTVCQSHKGRLTPLTQGKDRPEENSPERRVGDCVRPVPATRRPETSTSPPRKRTPSRAAGFISHQYMHREREGCPAGVPGRTAWSSDPHRGGSPRRASCRPSRQCRRCRKSQPGRWPPSSTRRCSAAAARRTGWAPTGRTGGLGVGRRSGGLVRGLRACGTVREVVGEQRRERERGRR